MNRPKASSIRTEPPTIQTVEWEFGVVVAAVVGVPVDAEPELPFPVVLGVDVEPVVDFEPELLDFAPDEEPESVLPVLVVVELPL